MSKLFAKIDVKTEEAKASYTEAFEMACRDIVNLAKKTNTYKDQTNNLRSSIGFVLYDRGEHVTENFVMTGIGVEGDGSKGIVEGKRIAEEAAKTHLHESLIGVIVAGMDYALCVEAKGYDVLTGSCLQAKTVLEKYIKAL